MVMISNYYLGSTIYSWLYKLDLQVVKMHTKLRELMLKTIYLSCASWHIPIIPAFEKWWQ